MSTTCYMQVTNYSILLLKPTLSYVLTEKNKTKIKKGARDIKTKGQRMEWVESYGSGMSWGNTVQVEREQQ